MIDQVYCENDYWMDYPRRDKCRIDSTILTDEEKVRLRSGETITKSDRNGTYTQYFLPIKYNRIES
jgi:hypothetical protein